MIIASILTEASYVFIAVIISLIIFGAIFLIIHLSQYKSYRNLLFILFAVIVIVQGVFIYKYYDNNIVYNNNKLLVYKGVPIFFFDVLIYPDGMFRLVDKKKVFNQRDQQTILNLAEYIVVIGSGTDDSGGRGFPQDTETQFVFNESTNQGIQIITLKNNMACDKFNTLKVERKSPMLILHNN